MQNEAMTPDEIYNSEQGKLVRTLGDTNLVARFLPNMENLRSSLYQHKLKQYPKLPKELEDIVVSGKFTQTVLEDRFLLKNVANNDLLNLENSYRVITFSSNIGLKILSKSERWHSDGTFEICPSLFYQVYVIHGCHIRKTKTLKNLKESIKR